MTTLENYPNENQLNAGINKWFDCVPASLDDALEYLTGKRFGVEALKTAAYGANYVGATAARAYIAFCASQGVKLFPVDGNESQLATAIHEQIQQGHPCLATEPDVYAPAHPDWSHVLSFYKEDPGSLTAHDPFGARLVTHTDAEWSRLFEFREIWVLERIEEVVMIDIHNPEIAKHFKELNAHQWQSIETGKIIQYAMLSHYKNEGNKSLCGWDVLEAPMSNEIPLDSSYPHGSVKQHYRYGVRWYNATTGEVKPLSIYDGPGQDPRVVQLTTMVTDLQKQLIAAPNNTELQKELDATKQQLGIVLAKLEKIKADAA